MGSSLVTLPRQKVRTEMTLPSHSSTLDSTDRDWAATAGGRLLTSPLMLACFAAICSIAIQSFDFAINNNLFHIAIVLRLYDLPQFATDLFVQSLRSFASPVYLLMSALASEENVAGWFFAFHVATRVLTFHAMILITLECGVKRDARLVIAVAVLVVAKAIYGTSPVGGDGMIMRYFTHSELAQAFALFGIVFLLRGRLLPAALMGGVAFDVNAFVGIWMLAPIGIAAAAGLIARDPSHGLKDRAIRVILAGLLFGMPALPVAVWIQSIVAGQAVDFDYPAYLRSYYGKHFFLDASDPWSIIQLVTATIAGAAAIARLRPSPAHWMVFSGLLAVFVGGAAVDRLTHSRLILNLHMLRVDGLIVLLAACFTVSAAVRLLDPAKPLRVLAAACMAFGLMAGFWILPMLALIGLQFEAASPLAHLETRFRARFLHISRHPSTLAGVAGLFILSYAAVGGVLSRRHVASADVVPTDVQLEGAWPAAPDWQQVGHWARQATLPTDTFLVPLKPEGFRVSTRRVTSGDFKEDASPLWAPATYQAWRESVDGVSALHSLADTLAYACARQFTYAVVDKRWVHPLASAAQPPVFDNRSFAVYRVGPCEG